MQNTIGEPHTRSGSHYLTAILIMGIYGGQVCPLVETLKLLDWFIELTLIFSFFYVLRLILLKKFMNNIQGRNQITRQFCIELLCCFSVGLVIAGINKWMYGFPGIESGLKIILGTTTLGFFMATDLALARERIIATQLAALNQNIQVDPRYFPMTLKFGIVAAIAAITVAAIILLVILKDLGWMMNLDTIDAKSARVSVIKEIGFVTLLFLIHIFNLILSYTKNLNIAVGKENTALIKVTQGNLDTRITVSSNDEFGIMAQHTNQMIAMLQKNTKDIQQTRDATIIALASLAETRDNETGDHILRTQHYVKALANQLRSHPKFKAFLNEGTYFIRPGILILDSAV